MDIKFLGGTNPSRTSADDTQETINWYPEITEEVVPNLDEEDGHNVILLPTPGLKLFTTIGSNVQPTPQPSPGAWWRGEDNTDDSINDWLIGFTGAPAYATGWVNRGFSLDGQRLEVPVQDLIRFDATGQFSICLYTDLTADGVLMGAGVFESSSYWRVFIDNESGYIQLQMSHGGNTNYQLHSLPFVPHLIKLTYDAGSWRVYIANTDSTLWLEVIDGYGPTTFNYAFQELQIYFGDTSVAQVLDEIYLNGRAIDTPDEYPQGIGFYCLPMRTPSMGGSVSGAGVFAEGASVTVTATPNVGYAFVNWTVNSVEVSTDAEYTFPMPGNNYYPRANFLLE